MIDLLLVNPPSKDRVFQDLGKDLTAIEPPVWSTLIATFIRNQGCAVQILDAEAEGLGYGETARRIAEIDPVLTAFVVYGHQPSASTQCMPAGRAVAENLRGYQPDAKTIVIGTHASALSERTLREEPYTFVCQGEGPHTVLALLEALKTGRGDYRLVPGLWYRDNGKIRGNPLAKNIKDLDADMPTQAWDLLDMSRYRAHNWHCFADIDGRRPYASLQTSLGCPYQCSFCCINTSFSGPGIRFWSPKTILGQIDLLVTQYGVKNIKIPDELFVLNEQHVMGICDGIIERGYDLNIWAYARVDTIKDKFLEKLKKAGFHWLALGIESGSKSVRAGVEKGRFRDAEILDATRRIRQHGIHIVANFIFGLPDDTRQSMQETLELAMAINAEWANFYCAMAYPGSPLYDRAKELRLPLPDDPGGPGWIGYSQHAYEALPLPTDTLSGCEVLDFRDEAFDKYFTSPAWIAMINKEFGRKVTDYVKEMVRVKIKRKHRDVVNVT